MGSDWSDGSDGSEVLLRGLLGLVRLVRLVGDPLERTGALKKTAPLDTKRLTSRLGTC